MACSPSIPTYLHWNNRLILADADFQDDHKLYRLGNPVEVPNGTYTALSCKWSFIIKESDVLKADDPPISDDYRYAFVGDILAFHTQIKEKAEGDNIGWHKLSCTIHHVPIECDYSHSEVNIKHEIFDTEGEANLLSTDEYTYAMWQGKSCLLQKKAAFFKDLRLEYRTELIKQFSHK